MIMASLKRNFIYNLSITLANYIASLAVFPYVSRCLGVELMGKTSFATNVIAYFSLFALLGAATVGTREIAICRDNCEKRSKVFSSVISVIGCLTAISFVAMTLAILFIPQFYEYRILLLIGSFSLVFTSFQIEWLYQGIEKFDYVAKRTVFIRVIYCISIFMFVHDKDDYIVYYVLTVGITVLNGFINLVYSRNYVNFSFKDVEFVKYLKPIGMYGVNKILISMYTTFNVLYLGLTCSDIEVGYYTTANKLFGILLGVISAFTSVILPRMAALAAENNTREFNNNVSKSFSLIFTISLPICIGGVLLSPQIIRILAGSGYEGAIIPMQIVMPVIVFTGAAQVCIMQVLIPLKKDKTVLYASVIGAVTAIVLNILFVGRLGAIGSALVLLASEIISDAYAFTYAFKAKIFNIQWHFVTQRIISSLPYVGICYFMGNFVINSNVSVLFFALLLSGFYFLFEIKFVLRLPVLKNIMPTSKKIK